MLQKYYSNVFFELQYLFVYDEEKNDDSKKILVSKNTPGKTMLFSELVVNFNKILKEK
jgi:hypothetical protein